MSTKPTDLASEYAFDAGGNSASPVPSAPPEQPAAGATALPRQSAVTPEQPQPTPAAVASRHDQGLVSRATKAGIDPETINASSPEELNDLIVDAIMERKLAAREATRAQADQQRQQEQRQQRQVRERDEAGRFIKPNGMPDVDAMQAAADMRVEDIGFKMDLGKNSDGSDVLESDFDPRFFNLMKKQAQTIDMLKKQVERLSQAEIGRIQNSRADQADAAFARLAPKYGHILGTGTRREIAGNSAEFKRRVMILNLAEQGDQRVPLADRIDEAAGILFGASPPAPGDGQADERNRQRIAVDEWNGGGAAIPTNRGGAGEPSGTSLAVSNLDKRMRARGIEPEYSQNGETSYDSFPG